MTRLGHVNPMHCFAVNFLTKPNIPYLSIDSDEQVFWLDVSVNDAHTVKTPHTDQHLLQHTLDHL